MLNISINDDKILIKNIDRNSIQNIYSIYRNINDFKYATGIFYPIEYDQFTYQTWQFIQRKNVFFLDIYLNCEEAIGIIKGSIIEKGSIVWINTFIINTPYQSNGYGKRAIHLLEKYLKDTCGIKKIFLSVYQNNEHGILFWEKCGFEKCDNISYKNWVKLNELVQIMCKLL